MRRRALVWGVRSVLVLGLVLGLASSAAVARAARAQPAGACSQPPESDWLFNGYNNCGVLSGAKPAVFHLAKPAHITSLADYHFHNGVWVKPGTIGLQASNGYVFGPYPTKPDTDGNWIATISVTVPAGTYTIVDSSPATWSENPSSGGRGFVRVFGAFVASAPPVPKPAPGHAPAPSPSTHPLCSGTPPSTFLIYPSHDAAGTTLSLLLWCHKPVSQGFQGAFAPVKVLIYDEASFRNLRYVGGLLQPISASLPVRPPIVPTFTVAGSQALEVSLPMSMKTGVYVAVIVDAKGEVASENLLNVP